MNKLYKISVSTGYCGEEWTGLYIVDEEDIDHFANEKAHDNYYSHHDENGEEDCIDYDYSYEEFIPFESYYGDVNALQSYEETIREFVALTDDKG